MVLRSNQTGFTNRMVFTDSSNGLLSSLGLLQSEGKYDPTNSHDYGYMTEIGTSDTTSGLNFCKVKVLNILQKQRPENTEFLDLITKIF